MDAKSEVLTAAAAIEEEHAKAHRKTAASRRGRGLLLNGIKLAFPTQAALIVVFASFFDKGLAISEVDE